MPPNLRVYVKERGQVPLDYQNWKVARKDDVEEFKEDIIKNLQPDSLIAFYGGFIQDETYLKGRPDK